LASRIPLLKADSARIDAPQGKIFFENFLPSRQSLTNFPLCVLSYAYVETWLAKSSASEAALTTA
jgi:hypothetical protein